MKIDWYEQGDRIDTPALVFAFNDISELFQDTPWHLVVKWAIDSDRTYVTAKNNLVINDWSLPLDYKPKKYKGDTVFTKGVMSDGTCREVYPVANDPALPFRAGLTVHRTLGTWSSLPHEFEKREILDPRPMPFFEQFAYVTDPPGGWAVQMRIGHLYRELDGWIIGRHHLDFETINEALVVRDRDIVDIPLGSHPVTASPGSRLAYFWAYWGQLDTRIKFEGNKAL